MLATLSRLSPEKDNKAFWDRWAERYDRAMSGDKDTYSRILNRMKRKLNSNMTVLELACGTGILSVQLAGNVKMLEATDFSEEMIKQAKRKCHSSRVHFSVQDATALPYAPETFDAVVIDRQIKLQSYIEQADKMNKIGEHGDKTLLVEFLRNAISEFPSEWQLQVRLANALISIGNQKCEAHTAVTRGDDYFRYDTEKNARNECWKEAVSLFEEVLKKDIDDASRTLSILSLIWLYAIMGDFENAEKTALSQSPVKISREVLLVCAAEDEKAEEYRGEAILALLHELYQMIGASVMTKHSISYSEEGLDTQLAIARLYESIFVDGNCGFFHNDLCMIYLRCSFIAIHLKDSRRALHYYEIALDHFLEFKKARATPQYTAPLVHKVKNYIPSIALLDREWFEESLQSLSFPKECVEAIRSNPRYASIFA